jgi:viroplasmin and RNaseH domain-containing protein
MAWYTVFRDRKPRVYDSWGVCSEYIIGFSDAAFQSYSTRMQAEKAYVAFLEHQNEEWKIEQVTQKPEDVANKCCYKDWVILV